MVEFYIGLHHPSDAWPFLRSMVSINTIRDRKSDFRVNDWIMDSGAFSQIKDHGRFTISVSEYVDKIERWRSCGNLMAAVSQDWMCEPFILGITGKTVQEHQDLTIQSYIEISRQSSAYILPVLQGFEPAEYVSHVRSYSNLLKPGQWVGVGSVCKRNGNPDAVEDVLMAIKSERPDLRLHGFGLKMQALERATVRALLHSSDSMAWSTAGRKQDADANDPRRALAYAAKIQEIVGHETFIQNQLFEWWK